MILYPRTISQVCLHQRIYENLPQPFSINMETYSRFNVIVSIVTLSLNTYLAHMTYQSVLFASFGSLFCGYTLSVIVSTLGQPTFYSSLHLVADPTAPGYSWTNTVISTANGVFFGAAFFGALGGGLISANFGRIRVFQISATVGIIGGAIQTGAISAAMVSSHNQAVQSTN